MDFQTLLNRAIAVVNNPDEPNLEQFLQSIKGLPPAEDELENALRVLLVDMTVAEYLGNCPCLDKTQ